MEEKIFTGYFDSPIGTLILKANMTSLVSLDFCNEVGKNEAVEVNQIIELAAFELDRYFNKNLKIFTISIDPSGTAYRKSVWRELMLIPFGSTISYGQLAKKMGNSKSVRAVAGANAANPVPIIVPCHRVIGSNGSLIGFSGGVQRKKWLLEHEGFVSAGQFSLF